MADSFDRNSYGGRSRRSAGEGYSSRRVKSSEDASAQRRTAGRLASAGAASASTRRRATEAQAGAKGSFDRSAYGSGGDPSVSRQDNPYSRSSYRHNAEYSDMRKKKKRKKVVVGVLVAVLVLVLGLGGTAFAMLMNIQSTMQKGVDSDLLSVLDSTAPAGDPFYMLLLGTDTSADRAQQEEFQGDPSRTDSIMLARIDPKSKQVTIISLMRDTMVDMGEYGVNKLNTAYSLGGSAYTVEVVSELAGVPISHYAEIDFDGFRDAVDAVGGITVTVPVEINDPEAGGYLAAGEQTLNGEQALILCRSRHTYDNIGTGKGDAYRAANQRMVVGALIKKILTSDPVTMVSTVQSLAGYVTTDLGVMDIMSLANNMRGMDMDTSFYTAVNPTESQLIDGIWWEVMDDDAWSEMMDRVDQGLPPTKTEEIDPETGMVMAGTGDGGTSGSSSSGTVHRTGTVSVRNGTSIDGAGSAAQDKIADLGYTTDVANADSQTYTTTLVIYSSAGQAQYAQEIVDALGYGQTYQDTAGEYLFSTDFLVVIGSDCQ